MDPPPAAAVREGSPIRKQELHNLVERRRTLDMLAEARQYTVVEVYLDSCAICRQLESGFGRFTEERPDVIIQRVHVPEDGLQFSLSGATRQEVDEQARAVQALMGPKWHEIPAALDRRRNRLVRARPADRSRTGRCDALAGKLSRPAHQGS
jgi:hypothetical protein